MKESVINHVAICQQCHKPFEVGVGGVGFTCDRCMDENAEEPSKVAWEDVSDDA